MIKDLAEIKTLQELAKRLYEFGDSLCCTHDCISEETALEFLKLAQELEKPGASK